MTQCLPTTPTPTPRGLCIGMDARETLRDKPRGIGLYGRHLLREFKDLCPEVSFRLYHERNLPGNRTGWDEFLSDRCTPVQASLPGHRFHTWERLALPLRLRRDRVQLYHGTYNTIPPRWSLWPGPPLVVSVHDVIVTWFDEELDDPYVRYCRSATPRILRQASCVLTVSEWSRNDIVERYQVDPARIRVTYNGIHRDFMAEVPEESARRFRTEHASGLPYLFAIGSPLGRKNTGAVLDAFGALIARRDLPHRLLISGLLPHQQPQFSERAEAAGIADRVTLLSYLDRSELLAAYAGADLFVYPSHAEGWGIPVLEAQALGVPVVTSNTTAMPEAGGEFALYFDPGDLDSMGAALERGIDDREFFASRRQQAIDRAHTFTWRRTAEGVLAAYRDIVP